MGKRVIRPEILDDLAPDDPRAVRSRRDLRWIDPLMGNSAWVVKQAARIGRTGDRLLDVGAGEGLLCRQLAKSRFPGSVTGVDRMPQPPHLPESIGWHQGDIFTAIPELGADIVAGTLILHHFTPEQLRELGKSLAGCRALIFSEPHRFGLPKLFGYALWPVIGEVTRHDLFVSIDAGFVRGELADQLGLDARWKIRESIDIRGALRLLAWRD